MKSSTAHRQLAVMASIGGMAATLLFAPALADTKGEAAGPIKARMELMETAKFATRIAGAMAEGKEPFDARKAELAMRTLNAVALGFGHKFPDDSKTGGDTEAKPEIWTDRASFDHLVHELAEHSEDAAKAAKQGLAAFKKEFAATTKYCKQCHDKFREEREEHKH